MEAKLVTALPKDAGWQVEPKWDGFRCLAFRAGGDVEIKAKSGKSLSRFFPEVLDNLRAVVPKTFVLDGELVIPVDGALSFDALQMRLHPAATASKETPAIFIVLDCLLRKARQSLVPEPFEKRRAALEALFEGLGEEAGLTITPFTRDMRKAEKWLKDRQVSVDGVVAKRLHLPYRPGERAMLKVNASAPPIASLADFATRPGESWWDLCCYASAVSTSCWQIASHRTRAWPGSRNGYGNADMRVRRPSVCWANTCGSMMAGTSANTCRRGRPARMLREISSAQSCGARAEQRPPKAVFEERAVPGRQDEW